MTAPATRPTIVCLCGSTRFLDAFEDAAVRESLAGRIVLTIASPRGGDAALLAGKSPEEAAEIFDGLAALHRAKIDLADEILVLNVGGYVGESTRGEISYAEATGTAVRYLEPPPADPS